MAYSFGEMLKKFRERTGFSQHVLAAKAEIDTSYISRLERGERLTTRALALQLSTILELSEHETDLWLTAGGYVSPRRQRMADDSISRLMEDLEQLSSKE